MSDPIINIVANGAKELNIDLPPTAGAAFRAYYDFLEERGKNVNLTAISGEEEVARLHFLDSLSVLQTATFINAKIIDIGSGAGFPGVPMKIVEPTIDLTLLDATGKRVTFLAELCEKLQITATCIHARAEEAAHTIDLREKYDVAVSRAVAQLNVLCELCLPFVRVGGIFVAMKSTDSDDEIEKAKSAMEALGSELLECIDYTIPDTEITQRAVIIRKVEKTLEKLPRRFPKIQKSPL